MAEVELAAVVAAVPMGLGPRRGSGNLVYAAHGTLTAMLADQSDGAGTTGVSLALSF